MKALLAVAMAGFFAAAAWANEGGSNLEIVTLSNRADLISGGDALVEVRVPKHGSAFTGEGAAQRPRRHRHPSRTDTAARTMRGVVTGLAEAARTSSRRGLATATATGGRALRSPSPTTRSAGRCCSARRRSHGSARRPRRSPESGNTPASNASGLSTFAIDAQCNIATEYKLFYRTTTAGCSSALPDPSPPAAPADQQLLQAVHAGQRAGRSRDDHDDRRLTVPYIVRVERGTINRGIYDIAVLFDPTKPWTALAPQPQWNGKVVYTLRRVDRPAAAAVPHASRTGPTTRRCRAASWSSTTA